MRRINVDRLASGMRLAKDVINEEGRILLSSGIELRGLYVEKLRTKGIQEVYIEDNDSGHTDVRDSINEETKLEAKAIIKKLMSSDTFKKSFNIDRIKNVIDKIIDELLSNEDILINLTEIKCADDYTFEHSVNVCVLSLVIGTGLGYNISRLKDLGMGAILHDIGKLRIPESILKKPSQLTTDEFEEIKKHTVYGYEILKDFPNISMISAFIAFGHHERVDGSGYPLQLKSESIHQCARIVAVADVYDALTSDRVYRKKLGGYEVIEYITSLGSHHFDKEIVNSFMKFVTLYPPGTGVLLNTREKALIVRANKDYPTRPVVRILNNSFGQMVGEYNEVNLIQQAKMFVVDTCEL